MDFSNIPVDVLHIIQRYTKEIKFTAIKKKWMHELVATYDRVEDYNNGKISDIIIQVGGCKRRLYYLAWCRDCGEIDCVKFFDVPTGFYMNGESGYCRC